MGRAFRAALALFLCLNSGGAFAAAAAAVAGSDATPMPVGRATTTPIGWIMFCRDNGTDCRPNATEGTAPRPLTDPLLALVTEINARINGAVKPVTDQVLYGVEERWTYPTDKGDCEDFALEKRKLLHQAGIPFADLLMTVVRKRDGEGHAILTVRTTGGDFVLDNLDKRVRPWAQTNYTFVKRQSSADPNVWLSVVSGADVAVGAVRK